MRRAARPGYLGGGLIGGQETVLRLVQLLQHPVPLVLGRPQQLFLRRDVLLQLGGSGGRARAAGTDRVSDTYTQHTGAGLAGGPPAWGAAELGFRGPSVTSSRQSWRRVAARPASPPLPGPDSCRGPKRAQAHNLGAQGNAPSLWPSGRTLYSVSSWFLGKNSTTPLSPGLYPS